uniref:Reverse transcriptase zinc-binding domain-containing protein n=2 Tax=Lactuca sativa TaxID=4236 RepID=A0A9R1X2H3_LACSA|nr:hypothetical protein LSAT_V11C700384620 [Lactuca sativa]
MTSYGGGAEKVAVHWVSWDRLKAPKDVGGAGLGSLRNLNLALLAKWWWKYKTSPQSFWARIIRGIHNHSNRPWYCFSKRNSSGVWSGIDRVKNGLWKLNMEATDILYSNDGGNTWRSEFVVDEIFNVAKLRCRLDKASHPISDGDFWWLNSAPKKVVSFIWRAKQGRIPSAKALQRRNIPVSSIICDWCRNNEETVNHILTSCSLARDTINMVFNWCGLPTKQFTEVNEVLAFARNWGHCPKKKELLSCVVYGTLWSLWKDRNDRIFRGVISEKAKIVDIIKATVFTWRKYRKNRGTGDDWFKWWFSPLCCS